MPTSKNAIFYRLGGVSFQNLLLKNDYPTYAEDFKLGSYILKYHHLNADNDEWIFVNSYTTEVSPADVGKTHIVRQFLRFFSENGALAAEPLFQYDTISVEGVIESWKTGNKTGKEAEEAIAAYNEWFWSAYAPVWNIDYGQLSMKLDSGMKEAAANTFFITFQTS